MYSDVMMNKQTRVFIFHCLSWVLALLLSGTFKGHKIGMGFFGVNFWSRDFFGFCWKP